MDNTLPTEAYDQTGSQLLLGITEFVLHKAELHASQGYLKCVGLEVACLLSTDSSILFLLLLWNSLSISVLLRIFGVMVRFAFSAVYPVYT